MLVLGIELWFSGRAVCALSHRAISLAMNQTSLTVVCVRLIQNHVILQFEVGVLALSGKLDVLEFSCVWSTDNSENKRELPYMLSW